MSKFTPSAQEVALVNQIFAQADTQKLGVVTGDAAVKIFSGSKLSPTVLAEIWNIADEDNNGVLTRKGVAIAIRLLGHAQRGEKIVEASVNRPGPVPSIEGLTPPLVQQTTGIPLSKSPPPGLPPLTPQDKAKFMKLFLGCGPVNGILRGEKARDVFVKSKLPVDKLSQIWNLADTRNRGALDAADFTIAMYFIQASMSGQLQSIPPMIPPALYEQASGFVASHATGDSGSFAPSALSSFSSRPMSTIMPQFSSSTFAVQPQTTGQMRSTITAPPLPARSAMSNTTPTFPFVQPQSTGLAQPWDVTPSEKASADKLFDSLDTQKKGYVEGDVAVPFMLQSKLPEDILAQVWDLADLNNDGRLTRDGFAVAMHLIQGKLSGKEIPPSIPASLIPPSMRQSASPAAPSQPAVPEAIRDLLWDDSPPASATAPQHPQPTLQPQATGTLSSRPSPLASPPPRAYTIGVSDPFSSSPFAAPAPHKDLLGDDDEHTTASPALHDQSAEIGNLKNQLASTNTSMESAKTERENVERTLAEQAAQLSSLQIQLSTAKAAYETETRLLNTLRERFTTQASEIQKAREDLIHAESDLSAVRVEKAEIEGAFLRDKEEVRELHRKMTEVGTQVETLKVEVEKAKKDAKQQKGLLAIAKKQLATREAETTKVEKELAEAQNEAGEATKEREEAEAELAKEETATMPNGHEVAPSQSPADIVAIAAAHPLPVTPDLSAPISPMSTGNKSTNPFERVAMASTPHSGAESPFLPFSNAPVLPTSPTAPASITSPEQAGSSPVANHFHFDQAFGTTESNAAPPAQAPTETAPASAEVEYAAPHTNGELDLISPTDTDMFATPPTTASGAVGFVAEGSTEATARFPDAATAPSPAPQPMERAVAAASHEEEHTDLDHQLKELEVDESDSESEAEDNEPLAAVQTKVNAEAGAHTTKKPTQPTSAPASSVLEDPFGVSVEAAQPVSPSISTHASAAAPSTVTHDVFGAPFATSPAVHEAPIAQALPAIEIPKTNGTVQPAPEAGVSDFDEAMGTLTGGTSAGAPFQFSQFTFESAFDDNFDFAAATAASSQPPAANGTAHPTVTGPQTGTFDSIFMSQPNSVAAAPVPAPAPVPVASAAFRPALADAVPETRPFSFDDAFGSGARTTESQITSTQSGPSNASHGISFDDAFGGHVSETLALDTSFETESHPLHSGLPSQGRGQAQFPTTSPPLSPAPLSVSPEMHARRSISPPARHTSPPPRHSSPKPRHSSDKEKVPSTRSSKLSIRLPFGRKKHKHDTPPVPMSQALVEEPTPAVDDDVEAVKQLCVMGFSRTQAVIALENNSYDFQRALNSLLGAQ